MYTNQFLSLFCSSVRNFGVSGTTMFKTGDDRYYQKYMEYREAVHSKPHIVIIQFGTNDVMHSAWNETAFVRAYVTFIDHFKGLETCPSIYLIVPEAFYDNIEVNTDTDNTDRVMIRNRINRLLPKLIREIASVTNSILIDGFSIMGGNGFTRRDAYGPDNLHLNDLGYIGIAHGIAEALAVNEKFYFITQKVQLSRY